MWPYTLIRLLVLFACLKALPLHAQSIESALMPGEVIDGHAKYETACNNCHVKFNRGAQTGLCQDCHKAVGGDVRTHAGYHGKLRDPECRACHTEHKGRKAHVVALDEKKFDHRQTDFLLQGKHAAAKCASCHKPAVKHRDAPGECVSCHRKEDRHKGNLGERCGNCHNAQDWKDARFDHQKTRFALTLGHQKVRCADCHANERYENTPQECNSCHRNDDAHKGFYGPRCNHCHNAGDWKQPTFRHERDARYALLDRHRTVKCSACHSRPPYSERTSNRCVACHRQDDPHKNALGDRCEKCHSERGWRGNSHFNHDADTDFPLRDSHASAKCESCHKDVGLREKLPTTCIGCHRKNDQEKGHKGLFGEKCHSCHNATKFKKTTFDHGRDTKLVLEGKHASAKCGDCHKTPLYSSKTPATCNACHRKDDIHFGSLGLDCLVCHTLKQWRELKPKVQIPPESLRLIESVKQ